MTPRKKTNSKSQSKKNMKVIETIAKPERRENKMESSKELKSSSSKRKHRSSK